MKSFSDGRAFRIKDLRLLADADEIVASIPDPASGAPMLRSHEVARVVGTMLHLPVVDGQYGKVDHSWLVIERASPGSRELILDVYCVGSLPQVRLLDTHSALPHDGDYYPGKARDDIDRDLVCRILGELGVKA